MATARYSVPQSKPKWVDPHSRDGGTTPMAPFRAVPPVDDIEVDRFHNHHDLSPEALSEAMAQLKVSFEALDGRVGSLEESAGAAAGSTKQLGRDVLQMGDALIRRMRTLESQLAEQQAQAQASAPADSVAAAPEAISGAVMADREISAPIIETSQPALFARPPAPRRKKRTLLIGLGLTALLLAALAGFWVYSGGAIAGPSHGLAKPKAVAKATPPPSGPVLYAVDGGQPAPADIN